MEFTHPTLSGTPLERGIKTLILLTGGGSGGPVAPLLAIVEELRKQGDFDFLWIGTETGPERMMVEREKIEFQTISNGKLRRYFSWQNFTDIFRIKLGFFQSLILIHKRKPSIILSAGAFVSVPVVWAAWFMRVPILIHQQDARPGLANKLMSPLAKVITTTFEKSVRDYGAKAIWVGNPTRANIVDITISRKDARERLGLGLEKPVILILGGGTGSQAINELVWQSAERLTKHCQILHITGKNKAESLNEKFLAPDCQHYKYFEFLDIMTMSKVYMAADVVISRAGMGVLTELSALGKASILIPIPDSHQEDNTKIFGDNDAAIILNQKELNAESFTENILTVLKDEELKKKLSANIRGVIKSGAGVRIAEEIKKIIK